MSKGRRVFSYFLIAMVRVIATAFLTASLALQARQQASNTSEGYIVVRVSGFSGSVLSSMRERMAAFDGRPYTMESRGEIIRAAKEIDPAARVPFMTQIETPEGSLVTTFVVTNNVIKDPVPGGLVEVHTSFLPEPLRSTMRQRLARFEGQPYTQDLRDEIIETAREVDLRASVHRIRQSRADDGNIATILTVDLEDDGPTFPIAGETRVAVSGLDQSIRISKTVRPEYPPMAVKTGVQGKVRFHALIDKTGRVINLSLVSGHPLLVPAAKKAAEQWTYQPTLLNGRPVQVATDIDVDFTLEK